MNTCGLDESSVRKLLKKDLLNQLHSISEHDLELIINSVAKVIAKNNQEFTRKLDQQLQQRIPTGF